MTPREIINPSDLLDKGVRIFYTCFQRPSGKLSYLQFFIEGVKSRYIPFYVFNKKDEKNLKSYIFNIGCIEDLIKWYQEIVTDYKLESNHDLHRFYVARTAFTILFLLTKHALEYYLLELSASMKQDLVENKVLEHKQTYLTLDDLVGYIWPSLLSITATGVVQEGTEIRILGFRPNIKRLIESTKSKTGADYAIYRLIPSPLSFFDLISEDFVYSAIFLEGGKAGRYRFLVTGFGSAVRNMLQDLLNQSKLTVEDLININNALIQISRAHMYIVDNIPATLKENWFSVVRGAVRVASGEGGTHYYSKSDAYLDVSSYVLATVGQYHIARKMGHKELVASLSKYLPVELLDKPRDMFENYVKRFITMSVRIW